MMGFDKGSDAFEVEAMGAGCDEEGLADGYCKEAWGGSVGLCVSHRERERGRTDATIGNLQLVGFEVGGLDGAVAVVAVGNG